MDSNEIGFVTKGYMYAAFLVLDTYASSIGQTVVLLSITKGHLRPKVMFSHVVLITCRNRRLNLTMGILSI